MAGILASVTDNLEIAQYDDWLVFVERLKKLLADGRVRRIDPLPTHLYSKEDEWYFHLEMGEIYVHVIPEAPRLPKWAKFDVFAATRVPEHKNDLSVFPHSLYEPR